MIEGNRVELSPRRSWWVLAVAGFTLSLIQFVLVRELTAVLRGVEIVVLLVTVSFFAGYSLGYALADRLPRRGWPLLSVLTLAIHASLPLIVRYGSGWLADQAGRPFTFIMLCLTPLLVSSYYSIFLPRLIAGGESLARAYAAELAGAAVGILTLVMVAGWGAQALLGVYVAGMLALLSLLRLPRPVLAMLGVIASVYLWVYPTLDRQSNTYLYRQLYDYYDVETITVRYSPYQRVDVVEADGWRKLYLDGFIHYGNQQLGFFNIYMAYLPTLLHPPQQALIIGSGSMASVGYIAPQAEQVTTVEIDPQVIAVSRQFYSDVNQLEKYDNWRLVIADGKQFLATDDAQYDLIVVDVTAPFTIQTGLMHSVEFYELARARLTENGVLAVSVNGRFGSSNPTPYAVVAAIDAVFEDYYILTPATAGRSFLFASQNLPFGRDEVAAQLAAWGQTEYADYTAVEARPLLAGVEPIRADNLSEVWGRAWRSAYGWWFER